MRLQTQWRAVDGAFLGLIYDSVFRLFDVECIDNKREMFADLQLMEFAALPILNERKPD